ncbi:putative gustatory receptor 28a [Periplaneta americana]|uniref:putative gustatory receptor 28a n=1 Tax=Periplaneta americana TaxID=6978 RepID=UPI0037E8A78E
MILSANDHFKLQANRSAELVHKILTETQDPVAMQELNVFSLQLIHRKVQFTACGCFPLDFSLLHSIAGAVTTYLVILIQFQLAAK